MVIIWVLAAGCLILVIAAVAFGERDTVSERLEELSADKDPAAARVPAAGAPRAPDGSSQRQRTDSQGEPSFHERLVQAGIYRSYSVALLVVIRLVSFALPFGIGVVFAWLEMMPRGLAILLGATVGGLGILAPSFFLDHLKARRQTMMRRALPDALDAIVVCLEGGLSLNASFARIGTELATVHPTLSLELKILEREVRVGRTTGEALRNMSQRFDLEELRSLSAVVTHAERYGASVTKALNVYASSLRLRRQQQAEAMAHKAAVKIMFPTVLCILPALFVVLLGPAVIQVKDVLLPIMNKGG